MLQCQNIGAHSRWHLRLAIDLSPQQTLLWNDLAKLINSMISTNNTLLDELHWQFNANNQFSVRSLYNLLNSGAYKSASAKVIWKVNAPLKVKVFLWLTSKNAILTRDNLTKRHSLGSLQCVLCSQAPESVDHLLLRCHSSSGIWKTIKNTFRISFTLLQ